MKLIASGGSGGSQTAVSGLTSSFLSITSHESNSLVFHCISSGWKS